MPRELFKGDRNKIQLVGLYPRGKRRLYSAVAYDGRCYLKKGKYRDNTAMKRTGTADYNQALAIAQKWIEDLRKQWDREFGASPGKAKGQLSIEDELNVILERIRLEKGEESLTYREYRFEADALFRHMGESRKLPPAQHTGPEFERLVAYRMAELESQASRVRGHLAHALPLQANTSPARRLPRGNSRSQPFWSPDKARMRVSVAGHRCHG